MSTFIISFVLLVFVLADSFILGCLITNCPRGGKRNGKFGIAEANIKPCISCGPGHSGQCFGPNICCGPFGCLMGTVDTLRCQRDGFFHEREPCIAGVSACRKNTGRCAAEGICCHQEACFSDKSCSLDDKHNMLSDNVAAVDLLNFINYQAELANEQ